MTPKTKSAMQGKVGLEKAQFDHMDGYKRNRVHPHLHTHSHKFDLCERKKKRSVKAKEERIIMNFFLFMPTCARFLGLFCELRGRNHEFD